MAPSTMRAPHPDELAVMVRADIDAYEATQEAWGVANGIPRRGDVNAIANERQMKKASFDTCNAIALRFGFHPLLYQFENGNLSPLLWANVMNRDDRDPRALRLMHDALVDGGYE